MSDTDNAPRGLAFMLAAAGGFALMSVLVKLGGRTMPAAQLVLARALVTLVLGFLSVKQAGLSPWGNNKRLLFLRGLAGTTALCAFYYAITVLPLGDATAIQYTNPVLTAILGALLLGESIRRADVVGALASIAGVILIARPSFLFPTGAPLPAAGLAAATFGAVISATAYVAVRALRKTDAPIVVVFWFPLVATPIVLPWALAEWVTPSLAEWGILLAIGVVTHAAQVCMTHGIHLLPAGRATSVGYVQVVLAFTIGVLAFHEIPTVWNLSGAALIIAGTLISSTAAMRAARSARRAALATALD